ncbi:hypothetical protein LUZ60_005448 [Juncus effusus]|nr:hypothetical protein LUZ60_005448 [Juncus effusus]
MNIRNLFFSVILFFFFNQFCTGLVYNVENFGAKGDGTTDSTKAFQDAWNKICSSSVTSTLLVPNKSYSLKPIIFSGPCRSNITFIINGKLIASRNRYDWNSSNSRIWLVFTWVENITITGGGTLDGNGNIWWQVSCKMNTALPCTDSPTILIFNNCKNLNVNKLKIINSPATHVTFDRSTNIDASKLTISSPSWSPNTDGIHITGTSAIKISSASIQTGDDCISMLSGTHNVRISGVVCGPGHGISIGSLGAKGSTARVSNVVVDNVYFNGTDNGVRIKTWQGGNGYVKNIVFKNMAMHDVRYPILIDQFYCDSPASCAQQKTAVAIINVHYFNILGTSGSPVAIKFNCSASVPCQGLELSDINLRTRTKIVAISACANAHWSQKGVVVPTPCKFSSAK